MTWPITNFFLLPYPTTVLTFLFGNHVITLFLLYHRQGYNIHLPRTPLSFHILYHINIAFITSSNITFLSSSLFHILHNKRIVTNKKSPLLQCNGSIISCYYEHMWLLFPWILEYDLYIIHKILFDMTNFIITKR